MKDMHYNNMEKKGFNKTLIFWIRLIVFEAMLMPLILMTAKDDKHLFIGFGYFILLVLAMKYIPKLRHFIDVTRDFPTKESKEGEQ